MSFGRLHKIVTYLIAGLGFAALGIAGEIEPLFELAIAVAFVASFFVEGRILAERSWTIGWTIGFLAFVALEIARGALGAPIIPLVLETTAVLSISRLFNRRTAREHQQIAALALLHLVAATVLSTDLAYAFAFLGFVVVAPWMLALSHLRSEIESQFGARSDPERERSLSRVLASRRLIGAGFLAGTAALALPLFAMTGLLFISFPRVGLGFLSFGRESAPHMTGFGSHVELGDFGVLRMNPRVVLRVRPPNVGSEPLELAGLRMRGTSFDHYDGRRWSRTRHLSSEAIGRFGSYYPVPIRLPDPRRDRAWHVVLDALDEPVIFVPPDTVSLEVQPRVVGGLPMGRDIRHTRDVDLRFGDPDGLPLRYTAWTSDKPQDRDLSMPDNVHRYLQLPAGHARVYALARRLTQGATDDEERIERIVAHLRDSGAYRYSLRMPRVGARAPLEVFLFEAKHGHCEYFSSAAAIMLRSVGVPTRSVTGFYGGRFNRYGGYYTLSQGDAHSWVEVWLVDRGWSVIDPTPTARNAIGQDDGWLGGLREAIDALRTRWSEHVVGYDLSSQARLFRSVRRFFGDEDATDREAAREAQPAALSLPGWSWALAVGLAVPLVVLFALRRRTRKRELDPSVREVVELYRALEAALVRRGHPRPEPRTPQEHVAALAEQGFADVGIVREVTDRYVAARFGGEKLEAAELERLTRAVSALRRKKRAAA